DRIGGARLVLEGEEHCRADGRMTRERQLPAGREDAQARPVVSILRREDEHRLGEVELARDRLHGGGVEPFRIEHDGERVAGERPAREDVEGREAAGHAGAYALDRGISISMTRGQWSLAAGRS